MADPSDAAPSPDDTFERIFSLIDAVDENNPDPDAAALAGLLAATADLICDIAASGFRTGEIRQAGFGPLLCYAYTWLSHVKAAVMIHGGAAEADSLEQQTLHLLSEGAICCAWDPEAPPLLIFSHLRSGCRSWGPGLPPVQPDPDRVLALRWEARRLVPLLRRWEREISGHELKFDRGWKATSPEEDEALRRAVALIRRAHMEGWTWSIEVDTTPEPPAAVATGQAADQQSDEEQRIILRGQGKPPVVLGKEKQPLTFREYNIVKALLDAGEHGLTKDKLDDKSGHSEARKVLSALRDGDPDWAAVIQMPGGPGRGGYRIK